MKNSFSAAFFTFALLLCSVAHAWVMPTSPAAVVASHTSTDLAFRPRTSSLAVEEQDKSTASLPYKVSTLKLSHAHDEEDKESSSPSRRRRTLWGQVQHKTVGFLLYTYDIDRKEFFGNV